MAKVRVTENELKGEITISCNLFEEDDHLKVVKENEPEAKIIPLQPAKDDNEQV